MSRFATRRSFGGRRAVVGDAVVLAAPKHDDPTKVCLRAGIVVSISTREDRPHIFDFKAGTADYETAAWTFVECTREEHVQALPLGSWTWPMRVIAREATVIS